MLPEENNIINSHKTNSAIETITKLNFLINFQGHVYTIKIKRPLNNGKT